MTTIEHIDDLTGDAAMVAFAQRRNLPTDPSKAQLMCRRLADSAEIVDPQRARYAAVAFVLGCSRYTAPEIVARGVRAFHAANERGPEPREG